MRLHPARAQATLELALILPFIVGLLAISLQGGLVISDQVNLEHSAYDASPIVTLAASGFPTPPANSLTFTHKVIQYDTSQGGFSSTMMTVTTAPNTLAGPYVIEVTGSDQCGGHGSASSDKAVDLTVKPG